jgi:ubiquinone biosynthesis monooxygenase Coq7
MLKGYPHVAQGIRCQIYAFKSTQLKSAATVFNYAVTIENLLCLISALGVIDTIDLVWPAWHVCRPFLFERLHKRHICIGFLMLKWFILLIIGIPMDQFILAFDKALRTLFTSANSIRPHPDAHIIEDALPDTVRKHAAGLMRVNHSGEICAQALYQGQALTARDPAAKQALAQAAREEEEHLAWTAQRVQELGSHTSLLNPVWYVGSLMLGVIAGVVGDKWNLGFLEETEKQVSAHLQSHLQHLPQQDIKSRAIVEQMYLDEMQHAQTAHAFGAAELPPPAKYAMKLSSQIMTTLSYYL